MPPLETPDGLVFAVRVQPRASRNEVAGLQGDALKVRLTAPPVEGEANRALVAFLAEVCGVRRADVELLSGETSRDKRVRIRGLKLADWQRIAGR